MRKIKKSDFLSSDQFRIDSPFIQWYAKYFCKKECSYHEQDKENAVQISLVFSDLASMRFSVGIDTETSDTILGVAQDTQDALTDIKWSKVTFLRRVRAKQGDSLVLRDWVVLTAPDIRIEGSGAPDPIILQIWLPATTGLLDAWIPFTQTNEIDIIPTFFSKGEPQSAGEPFLTLPLTFHGNWTKL